MPYSDDPAPVEAVVALRAALATMDPVRFRVWADSGLTTTQLRIMTLVRGAPGTTIGELAVRSAVTPPSISVIVDRLVREGLIRREDDPSDRRRVRNYLTERGECVWNKSIAESDRFLHRIFAQMKPADRSAFIRGHEAFVAAHHDLEIQERCATAK